MADLVRLIDGFLFVFFLALAVGIPSVDAQLCLPASFFPEFLKDLMKWYIQEFDHYLLVEKSNFYVGLAWLQLLIMWPLALTNLYGLSAAKSWFNTTCLIHGISFFTALVAVLGELTGSGKASAKLLAMYFPFVAFSCLAILRGLLLPSSIKNRSRTRLGEKKWS